MNQPFTRPPRVRVSFRLNPLWPLLCGVVVLLLLTGGVLKQFFTPAQSETPTLQLFCAAGMRVPIEEIVDRYAKETGVRIEIQFGGSQTLLSQLRVNQSGTIDLFLAADEFYSDQAVELGLTEHVLPIARSYPVVAVPRGNPREIRTLVDLLQPGLRLSLADPDQAAIGKAIRERLRLVPAPQGTMWEAIEQQILANGVMKPTVTDTATDLKLGSVDAGFVWDSTVAMPGFRDALEAIEVPELAGDPDLLTICVLRSSRQADEAKAFANYVTAASRGLAVFERYGLKPVTPAIVSGPSEGRDGEAPDQERTP